MLAMSSVSFQRFIHNFYARYGRHNLPWRRDFHPYKVLVSELMLQQTQVERVIPKFETFIHSFPNFAALAQAPQSEVVAHWLGLGYNRRALNLHKTAKVVKEKPNGSLPQDLDALLNLPGIGPYTAAAIQTFAFNIPTVMVETNIRAVFLYHFFPGKEKVADSELIPLIESCLDTENPRLWYSALMDYGTFLKQSFPNPTRRSKHHQSQSKFIGSLRQARGAILKQLLSTSQMPTADLLSSIKLDATKLETALHQLSNEGFVVFQDDTVALK